MGVIDEEMGRDIAKKLENRTALSGVKYTQIKSKERRNWNGKKSGIEVATRRTQAAMF